MYTYSSTEEALDRALLANVAAADCHAFAELYRRYAARLFIYVRRIVRDEATAEELVVDTMTAVWQGARRYGALGRVSTWILGIARHKALDAARSQIRARGALPLDDSEPLETSAATPLECASAAQREHIMRRALTRLSTDHREALQLAFYQELPYEAIAARLGIPENTVKTRVYYAKQALKRQLAGFGRAQSLAG